MLNNKKQKTPGSLDARKLGGWKAWRPGSLEAGKLGGKEA
jgi:hypothetical protein